MSSTTIKQVFYLLCLIITTSTFGQSKVKTLPSNINRPSINLYAPFISGDGQTMIYLSDYTDDGHHGMRWATKKTVSTWNDGQEVTKLINRPTLNFRGGYSLSFDGDMMIFTSRKSGLGGFDLWYSKRRGNDWEAPSNFGRPVNSDENDGAGMFSPDGEYLYFMRCDKMSEYGGASGCRLMVSKKTYNGWGEPQALPANINTGNSQTPRILADGETLVFASDQFGGKGGLDLYMTTKSGDGWSDPVPMDFINTDKNDQFVSIPAKGRYLFADVQGARDRELVQILIPEEFKPKRVMRIQGVVVDAATNEPLNANLTVFDVGNRDRLWNEKVGKKGEFAIVLKEGAVYDVAIDIDKPGYMYYSKIYDLEDEVGARDKETLNIALQPLSQGLVFNSDILFEEYSAKISDNSTFELRRIADMLRKNPAMTIEVLVSLNGYKEDSVQSDPDLTEIKADTIARAVKEEYDGDTEDQDMDELDDEMAEGDYDEQFMIRKTYHNDRTEAQAEAIKQYLLDRGVKKERITLKAVRTTSSAEGDEVPISVKVKVLSY